MASNLKIPDGCKPPFLLSLPLPPGLTGQHTPLDEQLYETVELAVAAAEARQERCISVYGLSAEGAQIQLGVVENKR